MKVYPYAKLTQTDLIAILLRLDKIKYGNPDNDSQPQIAIDFKVDRKTICRINTGKTWRYLTGSRTNEALQEINKLAKENKKEELELCKLLEKVAELKTNIEIRNRKIWWLKDAL